MEQHHRLPKVREATGMSGSTIYRLMDKGEFPRPVKISANIVAWPDSVLREWLSDRRQAS